MTDLFFHACKTAFISLSVTKYNSKVQLCCVGFNFHFGSINQMLDELNVRTCIIYQCRRVFMRFYKCTNVSDFLTK